MEGPAIPAAVLEKTVGWFLQEGRLEIKMGSDACMVQQVFKQGCLCHSQVVREMTKDAVADVKTVSGTPKDFSYAE